jgi:hypothetical protein
LTTVIDPFISWFTVIVDIVAALLLSRKDLAVLIIAVTATFHRRQVVFIAALTGHVLIVVHVPFIELGPTQIFVFVAVVVFAVALLGFGKDGFLGADPMLVVFPIGREDLLDLLILGFFQIASDDRPRTASPFVGAADPSLFEEGFSILGFGVSVAVPILEIAPLCLGLSCFETTLGGIRAMVLPRAPNAILFIPWGGQG